MFKLVALCALGACPAPPDPIDGGTGGSGAGGGGAGGATGTFALSTVDPAPSAVSYLDLAVDPTRGTVGIAYFASMGVADFELRYVEWRNGTATAPERVDTVQRTIGLSIDFDPATGLPAIAYLGGGSDGSLFWLQSDAQVAFRGANGMWTNESAMTNGFTARCGDLASDSPASTVVGLWPATKFDATEQWVCYRDVHSGQNAQDSWAKADVECIHGQRGSWPAQNAQVVYCGGPNPIGAGGHQQLVIANARPALLFDSILGSSDARGNDARLWERSAAGVWSQIGSFATPDTNSGAMLAWDSVAGYGVAYYDGASLRFGRRAPGATMWSDDPVFGSGTGGWNASLAFDDQHEPSIAFFVCSARDGRNASQCDVHELRVSRNSGAAWNEQVVDPAGGGSVRLRVLANGKRVIAYRDLQTGAVKLAVER